MHIKIALNIKRALNLKKPLNIRRARNIKREVETYVVWSRNYFIRPKDYLRAYFQIFVK